MGFVDAFFPPKSTSEDLCILKRASNNYHQLPMVLWFGQSSDQTIFFRPKELQKKDLELWELSVKLKDSEEEMCRKMVDISKHVYLVNLFRCSILYIFLQISF